MKAAVLETLDSPLALRDVQLTELAFGQVKVRVLASGLCGAQLQEISGLKGNKGFLPHLLGHEGSGLVEAVGVGVTRVKAGDKVVMHWRVGQGIDSPFPKYILNGSTISSGKVTTLSEFSIVSENRLTVVPSDTSDHLCALLGCGLTTAVGTINNEAEVRFGESVMIIGCGGVGLNLIQGARLASAHPIIGVDISEDKRAMALALGATSFVNLSDSALKDFVDSKGIDVIIDTTGNANLIGKTVSLLSHSGRYIMVGQPKPGAVLEIPNAFSLFSGRGQVLKATQGGKTSPNEDIARYVKLHRAGILSIDKIVTHEFKLTEINEAIDLLRSGQAGRIMIRMD